MAEDWQAEKFRWVEEKDFDAVAKRCECDSVGIVRAVSVWYEDILCGYFITCDAFKVRSFHGFKFVKGGLEFQLPMARKYIEEEKLEYSAYKTKRTKAVLRILGFRDFYEQGDIKVARKICHQ